MCDKSFLSRSTLVGHVKKHEPVNVAMLAQPPQPDAGAPSLHNVGEDEMLAEIGATFASDIGSLVQD